ncbi:hypothetical protein SAMN05421743_11969 [Thalassobacillus cyri]|uniref:Uncharacterized protein n=1 Tax=Thalassobacillus cyri TaxID=571932 RepID=A0A1H4GWR6_9BACI|nr:hypothetical protein SAMN05421743_11969 [Thalassobacillus cyri]
MQTSKKIEKVHLYNCHYPAYDRRSYIIYYAFRQTNRIGEDHQL